MAIDDAQTEITSPGINEKPVAEGKITVAEPVQAEVKEQPVATTTTVEVQESVDDSCNTEGTDDAEETAQTQDDKLTAEEPAQPEVKEQPVATTTSVEVQESIDDSSNAESTDDVEEPAQTQDEKLTAEEPAQPEVKKELPVETTAGVEAQESVDESSDTESADEVEESAQPEIKETVTAKVPEKTDAQTIEEKPKQPTKEVLNEVRAVIGGPNETVLILTQDIRPWLDGTPRTLRDLVIEQLILFDAESLKLQTSEEEVDRVVLQIQKNNNYTHEKMMEMLKAIDYTMEEFRTDLKRKHIVDMMLDYRVRNDKRMAVTEEEVTAWWNAHAENQFRMVTGHIKTKLSKDLVEKGLQENNLKDPIDWGAPFAVTEAQLPAEKQFITQKQAGEIVQIEPEEGGFEITKLISKGKEPLKSGTKEQNEKRYKDIDRNLRMERYGKIFEEYEQKLLKNGNISFKHEADRIAVMGA